MTLVAALAALAALPGSAARGQDIEVGRPFRVSDSGEAMRHIDDYAAHREAGRWKQAVAALDRLLALPPERGLVVRVEDEGPLRFEGVERAGRRLFDALPPEGVAAWEEQFRDDAERLLARGLRTRRVDDLRTAARRFPASDVRRRAREALASLALGRGEFEAATHELRALLALATTPREQAGVLARLAFARAQLGDREGVDRAHELAVHVLDEQVPAPEGTEPLESFLDRMARAAGSGTAGVLGHPQFGGDEHGTALSDPPPTPGERPRWRIAIDYQRGIESDNDARVPSWPSRLDPKERPVAPVVARGAVFVNTGLRLRAVDLSTGQTIWQQGTTQRAAEWRDNPVAVHSAAVAGRSVYAALATRADAPDMQRKFYGRIIVYRLPHRALSCYDARTGDVLWSHADEALAGHPDAAEIANESVASPPLVVGDDVIVSTWTFDSSYDVRLVCFDRHTGLTRWRRSLVKGQQELNLFGRPVKELTTGPLAERDGIVYVATGLGVAAGVAVADGSVNWLTAYPQSPIPSSNFWFETAERPVTWRPSPIAATRGAVVMAPLESPFLVCFEPLTGRVRWRVPHVQPPFEHEHFLGVLDGAAYMLGERLTAIDLETGRRRWDTKDAGRILNLDREETDAVGAGLLTADGVYVPCEDSIQRISTEHGLTLDQKPLASGGPRRAGGDLVSADGALLVVDRDSVTAHYRFEERRDRLLALVAAEPREARLRLELGEIYRGAGQLDDAIASFEAGMARIADLAPRARESLETPLRSSLFAAYFERSAESRRAGDDGLAAADLRRAVDVTRDRGDAVRALLAIDDVGTPTEARAALRRIRDELGDVHVTLEGLGRVHAGAFASLLLGQRHLAAGELDEAVAAWLDLLETMPDADLGRTDVRGAVASRIELARSQAPERVDGLVRRRAQAALEAARTARDAGALDRVARTYPDPRVQADAALLAAELHRNHGDGRAAVAVLRALLAGDVSPEDEAQALWALAAAYRAVEEAAAERMTLQRLARDHADARIDERPASELVAELLAAPRLAAPRADLPDPQPPLELLWDSSTTASAPQLVALPGRVPAALEGRLLSMRASIMELLDEKTGRPVWRTPTDLDWRLVLPAGEAIVVAGDVRGRDASDLMIRSFDAAEGASRWSRRLPGSFWAAGQGLGILYVMHAERGGPGGISFALSAVDLASGEVLASRDFSGDLFQTVVVAEDAVLVLRTDRDADSSRRSVLTLDGTTLALRGTAPLEDVARNDPPIHPPGSGVVVLLAEADTLVGIDVGNGAESWRRQVEGIEIRTFLAVDGGVLVADDEDRLMMVDGATGEVRWTRPLAEDGALGWQGLAAADGLVMATLLQRSRGGAVALALSTETGEEIWRHEIELGEGASAHPRPEICRDVVCYEVNERYGRNSYRSRVVLLDREDGREVGVVAHPSIGTRWQRVVYDRGYLAVTVPGELAVYGHAK